MKNKIIPSKMKIFLLFLLILSSVFYILGFIFFIHSGYKFSNYITKDNLYAMNSYFHNSTFNCLQTDNFKMNKDINTITLDFKSQDLSIYSYDGEDLKVALNNSTQLNNKINCKIENNRIYIRPLLGTSRHASVSIGIPQKYINNISLQSSTTNGDIGLKNLSLKSLDIYTSSGDINLSGIHTNYLTSYSVNGDTNIEQILVSNNSKISTTSGDINLLSNFNNLVCESVSGDISCSITDYMKNIVFNSVSGNINLDLPKKCGYKINYYSVSGELEGGPLENGNQKSLVSVKTVSGNTYVKLH